MDKNPAALQIYKSKAAIRIKPLYAETDEKGYPKAGGFMMTFAPSGGEGTKYSWDKAQGSVSIMLGAHETAKFCRMLDGADEKIFHDPGKGTDTEGKNAKSLSVGKADKGIFLNISAGEKKIGVPLDAAEIELVTTMLKQTVKDCYGW